MCGPLSKLSEEQARLAGLKRIEDEAYGAFCIARGKRRTQQDHVDRMVKEALDYAAKERT